MIKRLGPLGLSTVLVVVVVACMATPTSKASPSPSASPAPSSSPSLSVACGPLVADDCAKAIAVAEGTFAVPHGPFISVRIEAPTALMTCPPSGGPPGAHFCDFVATVTTTETVVAVGLVRTSDGWIWSNVIR